MTNGNDSVNFVPDTIHPNGEVVFGTQGLTKREYFAAMAFQGFLANTSFSEAAVGGDKLIPASVGAAEMLIKELNKGVK